MKKHYKTILTILLLNLMTPLLFSGGGHEGHGGHEEEGEHEEGVVKLNQQQIKTIGLRLTRIKKQNLNTVLIATGQLALAPQDRADVSPMIGGIVKEIYAFEGDKVSKGQVLAVLEHPDYIELQENYLNAVYNFEYLEKEFQRQKSLYKQNVGSGKLFQKTKSDYNKSKSRLIALKAKLKMMDFSIKQIEEGHISPTMNITSPMKGIVSLVETNIGSYAEPLSKLFEVVDNDKLHADFMIYEKDISKVSVGQKVYFNVSSYPKEEQEATIVAISPAFEKNPKAIHIHAEMLNHGKAFREGMYIHGRIVSDSRKTFVLPEDAVVTDQGKSYIFMHLDENAHTEVENQEESHGHDHAESEEDSHHGHNHAEPEEDGDAHDHADSHDDSKQAFKMIEIITGVKNNNYIEIKLLGNVPGNAKFADKGAYYLLAEMNKSETEHTH